MTKRPLLVLAAAGLFLSPGCRAPDIPDLRAFESGTVGMVDAVEGTYLATREVLDSAPMTPELRELHTQLERERAEMETTWVPVRKALQSARKYATTLRRLVHQRDFSEGELKSDMTQSLEGMFGPVGMLAGPLMSIPAGHELAKVAAEIQQFDQARRTLRRLRSALRVIHPAIGKLSGELRGDFSQLHGWTTRVFQLLHEQNRVLHEEALRLDAQLEAREKQIAHALADLAEYAVLGHDLRQGNLPGVAEKQQRQRLGNAEPPAVRKLREEIHQALAGVHQGKAPAALRPDLEALEREVLVLGPLASAAALLGSGPAPSAVEQALAKVRKERGEDLGGVEAALAIKLRAIVAGGKGAVPAEQRAALQRLRAELVARLEEHTRRLRRTAETGEGCDVEAALRGVLDGHDALHHSEHPLAEELDKLLVVLMRRGVAELRAQIEAVRTGGTWPCGAGAGSGGVAMVAGQEDQAELKAFEGQVDDLEATLSDDSADPEAKRFEDLLASVRRLRKRAEALGHLVQVDPDLSVPPPPTKPQLAARESYWKDELKAVNQQRLAIDHHLKSFEQRVTDLRGAEKHVRALLNHGNNSLQAWERSHLDLAAIEGRRKDPKPPAAHLENVVAQYDDQLRKGPLGAPTPAPTSLPETDAEASGDGSMDSSGGGDSSWNSDSSGGGDSSWSSDSSGGGDSSWSSDSSGGGDSSWSSDTMGGGDSSWSSDTMGGSSDESSWEDSMGGN